MTIYNCTIHIWINDTSQLTDNIHFISDSYFYEVCDLGPVRFVNWMRIPDAASACSNWMQQLDVVRLRFSEFWIMRLETVSRCSYVRFVFLYFVSG